MTLLPSASACGARDSLARRDRFWTAGARARYGVVALAGIAFLWSLNFWNLLGWHFAQDMTRNLE